MRLAAFRPALSLLLLLAAVALAGVCAARSDVAATFNPQLTASLSDPAAGAASDITLGFNVARGDVNFTAVVVYIPAGWHVTPGTDIAINARVGELQAYPTLGLFNSACDLVLLVGFDLRNGSVDRNDTVSFYDLNGNGTQDFAEDRDGNGIQDGIDHYPDFNNRILPGLQPLSRSAGIYPIAGIPILLQFLVFEPGTVIIPGLTGDPALGYPSVTLLENIGDPAAIRVPSPITDFCTPLAVVNVSYGTTRAGAGSAGARHLAQEPGPAGGVPGNCSGPEPAGCGRGRL